MSFYICLSWIRKQVILLYIYLSLSIWRVRDELHSGQVRPTLSELYEGIFNVLEVLLSPNTGQPFFVPSEGLASYLETILANGVKKEPKIRSMKFSPRTGIESQTLGFVVRRANHYTTGSCFCGILTWRFCERQSSIITNRIIFLLQSLNIFLIFPTLCWKL